MKNNSIYNKNEVPSVHTGCSMAETGSNDYDDFDNPLGELKIIPKEKEGLLVRNVDTYQHDGENHENVSYTLPSEIKNPSSIREEATVKVVVPSGMHPIIFLKEKGIDITKAWVFLHEDVIAVLRRNPCRFYHNSVAYGEFFRFKDFTEISLQKVEYFPKWKVILDGRIEGKLYIRKDDPETIIEVVME